jgi:hypothetical protein
MATIQYRWSTDGPFDLEICTDGSVEDGVGVGVAHVYAQGEGSEGIVARITVLAGNLCTSYRAEMAAIGAVLEEMRRLGPGQEYRAAWGQDTPMHGQSVMH